MPSTLKWSSQDPSGGMAAQVEVQRCWEVRSHQSRMDWAIYPVLTVVPL